MASVVVVGSGGREHAIVKALAASTKVSTVFAAPGNGGTEAMGGKVQNVDVKPKDVAGWAAARDCRSTRRRRSHFAQNGLSVALRPTTR